MSARHWSEETTCVGKKCLAAQVDLPLPAGPQSTTSVLRGMTIWFKEEIQPQRHEVTKTVRRLSLCDLVS